MRMPRQDLRGFRDADLLEHAQRLATRRSKVLALMQSDRLRDLLADGEHRIERGHRLLEDHGNLRAADRLHRGGGCVDQIDAPTSRPLEREST
jgi:hypothetical protein